MASTTTSLATPASTTSTTLTKEPLVSITAMPPPPVPAPLAQVKFGEPTPLTSKLQPINLPTHLSNVFASLPPIPEPVPTAEVLWWNEKVVTVKCPACDEEHEHGFKGNYKDVLYPVGCCDSLEYKVLFPFNHDRTVGVPWTGFQIDKERGRYYSAKVDFDAPQTVSGDQIASLSEELAQLRVAVNKLVSGPPMWTQGKETELVQTFFESWKDPEFVARKRIRIVVAKMKAGDSKYLKGYLDNSEEKDLFLNGVDEVGDSALIIASRCPYPDVVALLLEGGAAADFIGAKGRTALMEAALWGRYENLKCLLRHRSNKWIRDNHGLTALDLASPLLRNERERIERVGEVKDEKPWESILKRKLISNILRDNQGFDHSSNHSKIPVNRSLVSFSYHAGDSSIKLIGPLASVEVNAPSKTVATLNRSGLFPDVSARSGWAHPASAEVRLDGTKWTNEVLKLADAVGFRYRPDFDRDQGIPGRYFASHAESQLIAYFIARHWFIIPSVGALGMFVMIAVT